MQRERRFEYLLLLTIPLVVAGSCVHGIQIGTARPTGLFWIATLLGCLALLPWKGERRITFPWLAWVPFYVIQGASLAWGDQERYNTQLFVQMTVFFLLGIVASYAIESEEDLAPFNVFYVLATLVLGIACAYYMAGPGRDLQAQEKGNYTGFAERPAATSLIMIAAIFLAQIRRLPRTAVVMWLLCFGISILSQSRMATLVLLGLWLIHPRLTGLKTRVAFAGVVVVLGLAAFNTPIIQERFFARQQGFAGKGELKDVLAGKFDSAGRFEAWPKVWERSMDRPWFGHGVGQSSPFVYRIWAPMDKPHNEYLKMLYDTGYVGLAAFSIGLLGTLANLRRVLRQSDERNWAASAAYLGWIGFILMSIVDNPLVYGVNFLHPLFMMVGAANAIAAHQQAQESRPGERAFVDEPVGTDYPAPVMLR